MKSWNLQNQSICKMGNTCYTRTITASKTPMRKKFKKPMAIVLL